MRIGSMRLLLSKSSPPSLAGVVLLAMWGLPRYGVYKQGLAGEAELANADYSRQVAVREAQAKKDAAVLLAQAEVERAKGVAQANKIIGDSLRDNEAYLRYLFVNNLTDRKTKSSTSRPKRGCRFWRRPEWTR